MNRLFLNLRFLCCVALLSGGTNALALTLPFTENFESDVASWTNFDNSAPLTFHATGGPDNSSYASGEFNFVDANADDDLVIIRGQSSTAFGVASGGAFFGDWIADGVKRFSAQVRHNATVPLTFATRFADIPFPGAFAIYSVSVPPGEWTELSVEIAAGNPAFFSFEGSNFAAIFDGIGRVQFAISDVPSALAGVDQSFTFDIDQLSIVPEPTALALGILGLVSLTGLRRR